MYQVPQSQANEQQAAQERQLELERVLRSHSELELRALFASDALAELIPPEPMVNPYEY